jgi:hypothetical protein
MIENYDSFDVFVGVDVGKGEHHAVALDRAGKQLFDKAPPNDEAKLRGLIEQLKTTRAGAIGGRPARGNRGAADRGRPGGERARGY